jgi:outer membrane protein OmpA-like peptidoglycan-associated protein/opacity protein-like surface antigen
MHKLKSLSLLAALCYCSSSFGQIGGGYDYTDSAYINPVRLALPKNTSSFPMKPRDMLQLGFFLGFPGMSSDCPITLKGLGSGLKSYSYGLGVSARKSAGYVLSFKVTLAYYNMLGLDYKNNGNVNNSPVILENYVSPRRYVHNYRTQVFAPSFEALFSFNNIMFHTRQQHWNFYATVGISPLMYKTKMDLLDADGQKYLFDKVVNTTDSKSTIKKGLRQMMDGNYETAADEVAGSKKMFGLNLRTSFIFGAGIEYSLSKRMSLNVEYKRFLTNDDYMDGWYRQSGNLQNPVFTSSYDNIGVCNIGINITVGNSKKRVPPLWWLNPLDFMYQDVKQTKTTIKVVQQMKDDDGDGVLNSLDLEPNTPEGSPVDTKGRALDTDGDGIPDYKDKEKLTQQSCFPVDADGIGHCLPPACCNVVQQQSQQVIAQKDSVPPACTLSSLPSIRFAKDNKLSVENKKKLADIAKQIKNSPTCNITICGYVARKTKAAHKATWNRVNAVLKYLIEKQGVPQKRLFFIFDDRGKSNTIVFKVAPRDIKSPVDQNQPIKSKE